MNKILLTGEKQIGKTTIINKYIEVLKKEGVRYGGYRTFSIYENGKYNIYIIPASCSYEVKKVGDKDILVSCDYVLDKTNCIGDRINMDFDVSVFDTKGVEILENDIKDKEIIIMDEIGYIECGSKIFKDKILDLIKNDDRKILAVIRKMKNDFFDRIISSGQVKVVEINNSNRDEIIEQIINTL